VTGGVVIVLWDAAGALAGDHLVTVDTVGDVVAVWIDGTLVCTVSDGTHPAGRVGVFGGTDPVARFHELRLAEAAWVPWHSFDDEPLREAGATIRVQGGHDRGDASGPDGPEHWYAAELDPARAGLDRSRTDLRLRDPGGTTAHARSFSPESAYTNMPIRILRRSDGTGIALLPPGRHHRGRAPAGADVPARQPLGRPGQHGAQPRRQYRGRGGQARRPVVGAPDVS